MSTSQRSARVVAAMAPFTRFFDDSTWVRRKDDPGICDFVLGNPHDLPDLEPLSIDVGELQRERDRMLAALRAMGYALHVPEGTCYLLVRSPLADDGAFLALLAEHDVFCLPGSLVELPGTFRVSLTASDAMIDRALPGFEAALARVSAGAVGR